MNRARRAIIVNLVVSAALLVPPALAGAGQGTGNPVLTVSPTKLTVGKSATVTVTGTDYLVPPHAPGVDVFGGVYLFFGWVRPGGPWGPSIRNSNNNDGVFGVTYSYRGDGGDGSTRDDGTGTMRFVSFTSGGLSGDATPFHMDDNGNWTATLVIPASTYQYTALGSVKRTVNCQQVQCGVFTIGAHGKASATNEKFTPITFAAAPVTPTTRPGATPTTAPDGPPVTVAGGGQPTGPGTTGGSGSTDSTTGTTRPGARSTTTTAAKGKTATSGSSTSTTTGDSSTDANDRADGAQLALDATSSTRDGDGSAAPWIAGGALLLVGIGASVWFLRRRRGITA